MSAKAAGVTVMAAVAPISKAVSVVESRRFTMANLPICGVVRAGFRVLSYLHSRLGFGSPARSMGKRDKIARISPANTFNLTVLGKKAIAKLPETTSFGQIEIHLTPFCTCESREPGTIVPSSISKKRNYFAENSFSIPPTSR